MAIKTIGELKEMFFEACDKTSTEDIVSIHNEYCEETNHEDDMVYENNEYFFEEQLSGTSLLDTSCKTFYGDLSPAHDYVWFNGSGNLSSSDFERDMPIDKYEIFEHVLDDTSLVKGYKSFEDFVEAVEEYQNGEDEDYDEDEDEE